MPEEFLRELKRPIQFRKRPNSVAPDFRPSWKLSLLLLILQVSSRGGKSTLTRLHVLNWAVRSSRHQQEFRDTLKSSAPLFDFKVRFEPVFSRAIDLAVAAKLIDWVGGNRVELTEKGRSIAKALQKAENIFRPEVLFLQEVGKSLTEPEALSLAKGADIA